MKIAESYNVSATFVSALHFQILVDSKQGLAGIHEAGAASLERTDPAKISLPVDLEPVKQARTAEQVTALFALLGLSDNMMANSAVEILVLEANKE